MPVRPTKNIPAVFPMWLLTLSEYNGSPQIIMPYIPVIPVPVLESLPYGTYNTPYTQEAAPLDGCSRSESIKVINA
jgi:hypothetical protein